MRLHSTGEETHSRDMKIRVNQQTNSANNNNLVIENILSYNREFGKHNIFATALYSYEGNKLQVLQSMQNNFQMIFLAGTE